MVCVFLVDYFDVFVVFGVIIWGGILYFDYVCDVVICGIIDVVVCIKIFIGFGIFICDDEV